MKNLKLLLLPLLLAGGATVLSKSSTVSTEQKITNGVIGGVSVAGPLGVVGTKIVEFFFYSDKAILRALSAVVVARDHKLAFIQAEESLARCGVELSDTQSAMLMQILASKKNQAYFQSLEKADVKVNVHAAGAKLNCLLKHRIRSNSAKKAFYVLSIFPAIVFGVAVLANAC